MPGRREEKAGQVLAQGPDTAIARERPCFETILESRLGLARLVPSPAKRDERGATPRPAAGTTRPWGPSAIIRTRRVGGIG
jgi:hypothetical protein